jgi:ankyrin repeat protein
VLSDLDDDAAVPMLKLILQHWHTDLNTVCDKSPDGDPLLMTAAMHRRLQAARCLVAAGADLTAKSVHGHTVVHVAAQYDAVRILQRLVVNHKLNPCETAAAGWLPLHHACHMGCTAAAEYLLSLPQAATMLTAQCNAGCTALHYAAESEHDDIMQLLLSRGAAVDTKCRTGATPLMNAQRLPTVTILLNAHANVKAVDNRGLTVLHYCAKQGVVECVYKLLLKHGAVPTAVDTNGSTPAHVAGICGHFANEALLSRAADEYSNTLAKSGVAQQSAVITSTRQQSDVATATVHSGISSSGSSSQEASSSTDSALHSSSSAGAAGANINGSVAVESSAKQKKQKVKQPCANCSKLTTKLCRRCAAVYYCSTECQKVCFKDAKHRSQCVDMASTIV